MPTPLDPAALPKNVIALRTLLLHREDEHAAELEQYVADLTAARHGLQEQVLRNEQLKLRLARLLRERFGASSEKLRGEIEQLELLLGELEEQVAEAMPPEPDEAAAPPETETQRRKPVRKPLPATLPRDVVEHAAPCACPKCGGALRPLGEDVTEVMDNVPGSFRVIRHVRPKLSCRGCENSIAQAPAPSLPIHRGLASPALLAHVLVAEILRPPAAVSAGRDLRPRRGRTGPLDHGRLGWTDSAADAPTGRGGWQACHVGGTGAWRRYHGAGTGSSGRGKTKTGRLWCYARDDGPFGGKAPPAVLYCYSPDRKGEHPRAHLASFQRHPAGGWLCRIRQLVRAWCDRGSLLGPCAAELLRRACRYTIAAGVGSVATHREPCTRSRQRSAAGHRMPA